jgi:hypothetical protein
LKRNFSLAIAQKVKNVMHKNVFFIPKIIRPVFGRFCPKMAAVRPQIFPANHLLFSAGFELFCRIFGRLATVDGVVGGRGRGPTDTVASQPKIRPNNTKPAE